MIIFWLPLAWLVLCITPEPSQRNHYDGNCQSDGSMKEYDSLTAQEHDAICEFYGMIAKGDDT